MKRGSSVLQPPSDAAKRHTHTHAGGGDAHSPSVSNAHAEDAAHAAGSSPFPSATSLFSPDVSTKMASDLLIRLSEATQKAQVPPGSRVEAEPEPQPQPQPQREALLEVRGGQQDEPGLALSPDGPGASPEPPTLTHTPDATADTQASDLLRKLAERQEVNCHSLRVKEEEEPMAVDSTAASDLRRLFTVKTEDQGLRGNHTPEQMVDGGAKMADQHLLGLKVEDSFFPGSCQNKYQFRVKMEDDCVSGAKMEERFLFRAKLAERTSSGFVSGVKLPPGVQNQNQILPGVKAEEQLFFGAQMEEQCLRAVLWQDMSVNLASTLLHQLSERVGKSSSLPTDRSTPPIRSSPVLTLNGDQLCSSPPVRSLEPPHETQSLSREHSPGYFYRCHVCGFETAGSALFQSHMTDHRQWERASLSLHCCVCDHSTNQEAEMRAHATTHIQGDSGAPEGVRCSITPPATTASSSGSTPAVAMATQPEKSTSEHRCRICQRSFPGQQELLVHFQGHRQGNQYRCDRCGHLTRTANKLVEHVRVHTGERPFTCSLCPYSAKRRDSLRLHCKVKHGAHVSAVHTHRSYVHADNRRSHKQVQRLHTPAHTHTAPPPPSSSLPPLHPSLSDRAGWRDLSPLLPITTLLSLKPRPPPPSPSSSSSSSKHSFLGYLGLTRSL